MNGDGLPDWFAGTYGLAGIYYGRPGGLSPLPDSIMGDFRRHTMDWNGDGYTDIVVIRQANSLSVYYGSGI